MKSKLFKAVFGISLFALALNVNANTINSVTDGSNTTDATVTVGEVEVPVYEVNVLWDNLTFDWKYDIETEKFGWKPADVCEEVPDYLIEEAVLYADNNCQTKPTEINVGETYYRLVPRESVSISIEDYSSNGSVVPSINWNASNDYQDVVGKFQYRGEKTCVVIEDQDMFDAAIYFPTVTGESRFFSDSNCSSRLEENPTKFEENKYYVYVYPFETVTGGELPESAEVFERNYEFNEYNMFVWMGDIGGERLPKTVKGVKFKLEGGTTTPTAGDEIGTITVSIRAK